MYKKFCMVIGCVEDPANCQMMEMMDEDGHMPETIL